MGRHIFYIMPGTLYGWPSFKSHNDHMKRAYDPILQVKKLRLQEVKLFWFGSYDLRRWD